MIRKDGRSQTQLRVVEIETNVFKHPEGSVVINFGETKVIISATVEESVPKWLEGTGKGWVTAEYNMLPRATNTRNKRERNGKVAGRTMEIQRLIGRSLRAVMDLEKLGERSIIVDCDVIQADGGTRTASITGAYVALKIALETLVKKGKLKEMPLIDNVAAISVGILSNDQMVADLNYEEDSTAKVDMNLVMTGSGKFVEIQGTGEESTFSASELNDMLSLGTQAIEQLTSIQEDALKKVSFHVEKPMEQKEQTIIIATRNPGKAKEFVQLFEPKGYKVETLLDYPEIPDVEETGVTFEENARLKAETIAKRLHKPVLADDSGLMVDVLGGFPGVYSARYSMIPGFREATDTGNNAKLLGDLHSQFVKGEKVKAQFHCTLVFAHPEKESLVVEADWHGEVVPLPKGENGFGYDPLFLPEGSSLTSGQLSNDEKNKVSHRAQAVKKLSAVWEQWLNE